jgi:PleD family two-component response regulator
LFAAADEALYRAKAAGKNRVVCAESDGAVRASQ